MPELPDLLYVLSKLRERLLGRERRPAEAERLEDSLAQQLLVGRACEPRDGSAEDRVGEIRVVPGDARREHLLGIGEAREQAGGVRQLQRLPDVAWRLALDAGEV